jgi:hypothetical protein
MKDIDESLGVPSLRNIFKQPPNANRYNRQMVLQPSHTKFEIQEAFSENHSAETFRDG